MGRIAAWRQPWTFVAPVHEAMRAAYAEGYLGLDPDRASAGDVAERHRSLRPLLSNTISSTGLSSGVKHNVIPAQASATIDCRLLPGYDRERFIAELRRVIDDPRVEVETVFASDSPVSESNTGLYDAIKEVCHDVMPEAALLPRVTAGFTDSRVFRRHGVPAYGFVPMLLGPDEQGGMHGNDERISLKNLRLGVEVLYRVVERMCVA
jgi:acetylornithine deacetylase/succinyl-diaminopimelate desuccinylase-like protein